MFQLAVCNFGVSPSEFWNMTMPEWFALYEVNRPNQHAGNLNDDKVDEMLDDMDLTEGEWWQKYGPSGN